MSEEGYAASTDTLEGGNATAGFPVERGVPIPGIRRANSRYPFKDLEVGESFYVNDRTLMQLYGAISHAKKTLGRNFVARSVEDGVRVWRTG